MSTFTTQDGTEIFYKDWGASSKLVKDATLKIYEGGPHGLATTRADELNADLLEFIEAGAQRASGRSEGASLTH